VGAIDKDDFVQVMMSTLEGFLMLKYPHVFSQESFISSITNEVREGTVIELSAKDDNGKKNDIAVIYFVLSGNKPPHISKVVGREGAQEIPIQKLLSSIEAFLFMVGCGVHIK
jgi:hypothetical protein